MSRTIGLIFKETPKAEKPEEKTEEKKETPKAGKK